MPAGHLELDASGSPPILPISCSIEWRKAAHLGGRGEKALLICCHNILSFNRVLLSLNEAKGARLINNGCNSRDFYRRPPISEGSPGALKSHFARGDPEAQMQFAAEGKRGYVGILANKPGATLGMPNARPRTGIRK